MICNLC